MSSTRELTELGRRKQLLVTQADLHREIARLEVAQWTRRRDAARAFLHRNRWWLLGGTLAAGVAGARRWRSVVGFLSLATTAARALRR